MNVIWHRILLVLVIPGVFWGQELGERNQTVNPPPGHTGEWIAWYANGQKKCESYYVDGKRDGKWFYWYEDGVKTTEIDYIQGQCHGNWVTWHPNGKKAREATFSHGEMIDSWTYWNEEGELRNGVETVLYENAKKKSEEPYVKGKRHGICTYWYENGIKHREENYRQSRPNGASTTWYRNGQKQFVNGWKDGEKHGTQLSWHRNGWKQFEFRFHEGELVECIPISGSESPREWGIQKAKEDIKHGKKQIFYFGPPWPMEKPLIDEQSRLRVEIVEGCIVAEDFVERVNAYNETMRASAKAATQPTSAPVKK